jgi:hypothetical protein
MRYFFDIVEQTGEIRDPEGTNFGTPEKMRQEAKRVLALIAAEEPYSNDALALAIKVRDERDHEVYNLCLSIKGKRPVT